VPVLELKIAVYEVQFSPVSTEKRRTCPCHLEPNVNVYFIYLANILGTRSGFSDELQVNCFYYIILDYKFMKIPYTNLLSGRTKLYGF